MSINQMLLPEFDQEMANTRPCLERVPDDKISWAPHEKSMTLGRLASHIAEIPIWLTQTLATDSLDLNPPGGEPWQPTNLGSSKEIVDFFDAQVAEARKALEAASDDAAFHQPWSLLSAGHTYFTMPRIAVIRSMVMNHLVHHRGQLTVYLRLHDVPVPSTYGPSADEGQM